MLFFDLRRASYVILLISMLDWNSLVNASPLNDIFRLSFWKTERLHVCLFQLILLTKMQFFFGSMWLLHCSWFFFSRKSFLLDVNKISCIHGSFLLSPTLSEIWNFHAWPKECVCYMFSFSLFRWFHKLWWVLCLHIVWLFITCLPEPSSTVIKPDFITSCSWMLKIFYR